MDIDGAIGLTYLLVPADEGRSRGGVSITGATSATYALVPADAAQTITVTVTGAEAGYTTESKTSAPTASVTMPLTATPAPTITGTRSRCGSSARRPGTPR